MLLVIKPREVSFAAVILAILETELSVVTSMSVIATYITAMGTHRVQIQMDLSRACATKASVGQESTAVV